MQERPSRATAVGGRPSLDKRTELIFPGEGCWGVTVWPEAGEAVIYYKPIAAPGRTASPDLDPDERAEINHQRATRRARSEARRYLVANRLRYMWVLTFANGLQGPEGRAACMKEVARFASDLRGEVGGLAYWYSPELHPGGHGWHVNFFVAGRIPHGLVERLWGKGFVFVKDWVKDSRVQEQGLRLVDAIRLGAEYGCKYASKDWSAEMLAGGAHRYEVAEGYRPKVLKVLVPRLRTAFTMAERYFGDRPADHLWMSAEADDWCGPPVWCLSWRIIDPDDIEAG